MAAHRSNARSNRRRADTLAVVRWLKVGAASAGISAALLGWSAAGPAVGIAAADDSGQSSSASSDSPASKDDKPEQKADKPASNDSATGTKDDEKDDGPAKDDSPVTDDDEAAEADDEEAEPTKESEPTADPEPAKDSKPANDGQRIAAEPDPDPEPTPARTAAASPVSAPAADQPTVTTAAAPQVTPEAPAPAAAAAPAPPWALQAVSSHDARQQAITAQLNAFTASVRSLIDALPLHPVFKVHLEGALWTARRTFFNQAPTVAPITVSSSGGPIAGRVDAVDPEGDRLVYRLSKAPSRGTVLLNPDGFYTYTPGAGFNGVDTFVITADDMGTDLNLINPFRGVGTSAGILLNQGAITFTFNYTTTEDWTAERQAALTSSANALVPYFLVNAPVTLTYDVNTESDAESTLLASAGSSMVGSTPGFWRTVVQNKLISGIDANGSQADGQINWNWAQSWGLGDSVSASEFDFKSTLMHELLHSFGWLASVDEDAPGIAGPRAWQLMDSFIVDVNGAKAVRPDYAFNAALTSNLTGGGGGLFLGGANAVAAYGGLVPIFTPNPVEPGSTTSHLDDVTFTGLNQMMMNAKTDTGLGVRVLSAVELAVLKDLGYTVVPQSSAAFGLFGF